MKKEMKKEMRRYKVIGTIISSEEAEELGRYRNFTHIDSVYEEHIECPHCGSDRDWILLCDYEKEELVMGCVSCREFVIPLVPKPSIEWEQRTMMDLQKRVRKLEREVENDLNGKG